MVEHYSTNETSSEDGDDTFTLIWRTQLWERQEPHKRIEPNPQSPIIETFHLAFMYEPSFKVAPCWLPISRPLLLCEGKVLDDLKYQIRRNIINLCYIIGFERIQTDIIIQQSTTIKKFVPNLSR